MSRHIRKTTTCIGVNKDADQLCSHCTADQRLCFSYSESSIPLLLYTAWFMLDLVRNPDANAHIYSQIFMLWLKLGTSFDQSRNGFLNFCFQNAVERPSVYMSHEARKPVFGVSDQVRRKLVCTFSEES